MQNDCGQWILLSRQWEWWRYLPTVGTYLVIIVFRILQHWSLRDKRANLQKSHLISGCRRVVIRACCWCGVVVVATSGVGGWGPNRPVKWLPVLLFWSNNVIGPCVDLWNAYLPPSSEILSRIFPVTGNGYLTYTLVVVVIADNIVNYANITVPPLYLY